MALVVTLVLATVAGIVGHPVYVTPRTDELRRADAIFVLGGAGGETRYRYAVGLADQGLAPDLVMSNPKHFLDDTGLCRPRPGVRVDCFQPDPSTTRGEAQKLRDLARQRGWRTVIVVTFRPHISRARYIVGRCFPGRIVMAQSPQRVSPFYWPYAYVYQTAGFIRAGLQSGC
ncbi:YdcF family protein [Williamsia sp. CHRR-6]|nr:YdcF family protein [Williamsia sp. CHRR-6]